MACSSVYFVFGTLSTGARISTGVARASAPVRDCTKPSPAAMADHVNIPLKLRESLLSLVSNSSNGVEVRNLAKEYKVRTYKVLVLFHKPNSSKQPM